MRFAVDKRILYSVGMTKKELNKFKLPDGPGVYVFKKGRKILYIGKATSLRDRVRSYFSTDLVKGRGERIVAMVAEAKSLAHIKTDSILEALILEANLIKKHQPTYNVDEKDNKSFNYIVVTKEDFPRVLVVRGRELFALSTKNYQLKTIFGPFPHGTQLQEAMKIIRRIFPFRDAKCVPCEEQHAARQGLAAYDALWVGVTLQSKVLAQKIRTRLLERMKRGMVAEARQLHADGLSYKRMDELGLEYRSLARLLQGIITRKQMVEELNRAIRKYAIRQIRYWKRNKEIRWFKTNDDRRIAAHVRSWLRK